MFSQPFSLEWNYERAIDLNWSESYSKLADVYVYIDMNGKENMRVIEWIKFHLLIIWKKIVLNWIFFRSRRYGQTANQPANIIDWFLYKKNWCANYKSQRVCVRLEFGRPLCAMLFNSSMIFSSWISFFITNDVSHGPNYLCVFSGQDIIFVRQNDESITHSMSDHCEWWLESEIYFFCQKFASSLGHLDIIRSMSLWLHKSNKLNLIAFPLIVFCCRFLSQSHAHWNDQKFATPFFCVQNHKSQTVIYCVVHYEKERSFYFQFE